MLVTLLGMVMLVRLEQFLNAPYPRLVTYKPISTAVKVLLMFLLESNNTVSLLVLVVPSL
jgi:hypothetical protein